MKRMCSILGGILLWYGFSRFSWLCLYAVCDKLSDGMTAQVERITSGYSVVTLGLLFLFLLEASKPAFAPNQFTAKATPQVDTPPQANSQPPPVQSQSKPTTPENTQDQSPPPQNQQGSLVELNHKAISSDKTFHDIAGYATTKENMKFMVDCMKQPETLVEAGAKIPKGVIFYGPAGTGKTLMASAVAGTAGVPFISINASAFINTYVGTGPHAVRKLYQDARAQAPCVVFIDELDAVGGKRSGDQNQEYRMTINALLSELDGMETKEGVMTIAATNAVDLLDDALIRAGRFDRKVMIPLPDAQDRLAILRLHARKKKLASDVNLTDLAHSTEGFSGATLATLLNEAALMGVAEGSVLTTKKNLDKALLQLLTAGEETPAQTGDFGRLVAWHEAGHALCRKVLCGGTVPQVTIKGSSSGALGLTITGDLGRQTRKTMKAEIKTLYAGRVAEQLFYGNQEDVTVGASQDIRHATQLIKDYVQLFGLGDGSCLLHPQIMWGEQTQVSQEEKEAVSHFAQSLYAETEEFLRQHLPLLETIANALVLRETLDDHDLTEILTATERSEKNV